MSDVDQTVRDTLKAVASTIHAPPIPLADLDRAATTPRRYRSRRRHAVLAGVVALLLGSGAVAAATGWDHWVRQVQEPAGNRMGAVENSDLFAPGGLFACTDVLRMTPREVVDLGRDRGFTVFRWQYEGRPEWPQRRMPPAEVRVLDVIPFSYELLHIIVVDQGSSFDSFDSVYADRAVCDDPDD